MRKATYRLPIFLWILRIVMSAVFFGAAIMKLSGQEQMVAEFAVLDLGQGFRVLTGVLEAIGAMAILVPEISMFGAAILMMVDLGAFVAQISVLHMDWVHTVLIGVALGTIVYLQRARWPLGSTASPERGVTRLRC